MHPDVQTVYLNGFTVTLVAHAGRDYLDFQRGSVRVGWVDIASGEIAVDQSHWQAELEVRAAYSVWVEMCHAPLRSSPPIWDQGSQSLPAETPPPSTPAIDLPPPVLECGPDDDGHPEAAPWTDLAANKPGQAARAQANAEYAKRVQSVTRVGAWLSKALDHKTDERAWRVGADGEETVGKILKKLERRGYRALHAIPIGDRGSDIDHLLVGPSGIYTINTKAHRGGSVWVRGKTVKVNGHNVPYVRNSTFEAARTSRILATHLDWIPPVTGVIVILTGTSPTKLTVKEQPPETVRVVGRSDLPRWFLRRPEQLNPDQCLAIYEVARRSTTWISQ